MDATAIGKKLIVLRGDKTQKEVSEACLISISALAMYETGRRIPRDEVKIRLAEYYEVGIQDLFFDNEGHAS